MGSVLGLGTKGSVFQDVSNRFEEGDRVSRGVVGIISQRSS